MGEIAFLSERVRSPVLEGWFYPEKASVAMARLRSFGLERGKGGMAAAILAPHGAWEVSGAVAGRAFIAAAGRAGKGPDKKPLSRVIILGTVHDAQEEGLFLSDSAFFETPLGNLPVDRESSEALASCSTLFEINDIPHLREHSLEILLPLVKYCFPSVKIVPILMGSSRPILISGLARALRIVFEPVMEETLFVISCNLSKHPCEELARSQAEECIRLLGEKDFPGLITGIQDGNISACGAPLAASLLESGLIGENPVRLVSGPLVRTGDGEGNMVYFGGLAFG